MTTHNTVAAYLRQGLVIEPHEAVAIAQELIATSAPLSELEPPFGPPTIDNVDLSSDGGVLCRHCGVTPAVSELGRLLEAMLSSGGSLRAPGGLRYTIARALNDVDAPPFDSLTAFSAALARYERRDRCAVLRDLAARALLEPLLQEAPPEEQTADQPFPEEPIVCELPLFDEIERRAEPRGPIAEPDQMNALERSRNAPWLVAAAVVASICFSATYVLVSHARIHRTAVGDAAAVAAPEPTMRAVTPPRATESTPEHSAVATTGPTTMRDRAVRTTGSIERLDGARMFSPAFASNGTALFFHTGRSSDARSALAESRLDDLEVMTILDDGAKNYHVQPSPDGTRIAFDSDRDGERGVYVANRDGGDVHRVSGPGFAAVPSWSPDGTELAFNRAEPDRPHVWNLWLTTLATSQSRRLTNFRYGQTWGASWFAAGDAVAYTHEDELTVLNLATGSTRIIKSPVAGRLVRTAAVSPDGRRIIFQVSRSGAWVVDLADGSMRCALTDPSAEEFAWSPDGRRVAFHSRRDGQWGVWVMTES